MSCGAAARIDVSVGEQAGTEDGATVADSGDCASPGTLRLPQDPSAVEPGRLEGGKEVGVLPCTRKKD